MGCCRTSAYAAFACSTFSTQPSLAQALDAVELQSCGQIRVVFQGRQLANSKTMSESRFHFPLGRKLARFGLYQLNCFLNSANPDLNILLRAPSVA